MTRNWIPTTQYWAERLKAARRADERARREGFANEAESQAYSDSCDASDSLEAERAVPQSKVW